MLKNSQKERCKFANNSFNDDIRLLVNESLGLDSCTDKNQPSNFNGAPSEILSDFETTAVDREDIYSNCGTSVLFNRTASNNLKERPYNEDSNITDKLSSEEGSDIEELKKLYIQEHTLNSENCLENEENIDNFRNSGSIVSRNSYLEFFSNGTSNLSDDNVLREKSGTLENILESEKTTESVENNENAKNVCPRCFKSFRYPSLLKRHLRSHERVQKCEKTCDSGSTTTKRADSRSKMSGICKKKLNDEKRVHQCPACLRSFKFPSKLKRHMKTHVGLKPYVCHLCSRAFLEEHNLVTHKQVHSNEQPHICNICQKAFGLKSNLSRHLRSHTKEKICGECGIVCYSEKKLSLHILRHHKVHKCTHCEREFKKKSNLRRHLEIHFSEKMYPCNNCDYIAGRKSHLERHVVRNHAE